MSTVTPESLYGLLPAVHRVRDTAQGGPLQALLALAAQQGAVVESDIERLLDNWFIETCDEWVVPYLGDLLGVRGLHSVPSHFAFSQRARVANTLGYRRRKGTATMLEQLARDTTGWPARAVEFFEILGWNQNPNHVRSFAHRTPDLRRTNELELLNTAFDSATHTVDVRRIEIDRGRHNLPNIGLFLWRLQSYYVPGGTARENAAGFYTFNPLQEEAPLQFNRPLFNRPQTETDITHLAEEINVPGELRRRPLYDELEARRLALAAGHTPRGVWFNATRAVLRVFRQSAANADFLEVPPHQIRICHLGESATRPDPVLVAGEPTILVGVDPVLGRIAWADTLPLPVNVKVGFAYGFSGDLGGGPYDRTESVAATLALGPKITWQVGVARELKSVNGEPIHPTLADAVADWNAQPPGSVGVIAVMDSHTYNGDLAITLPRGSRLLIVAADWPAIPKPDGGKERRLGQLNATELRPHVLGNISIAGTAVADRPGGVAAFDGLLIEGKLTVLDPDNHVDQIRICHTTLVPELGGIAVTGTNAGLKLQLIRSITGTITIMADSPSLSLEDCIVDAGTAVAIAAEANALDVQNTSVLGRVNARRLDAGNSIFTGLVKVARRQEGCVRFCYVPPASATGRRYRCQPDLAREAAEQAAAEIGETFGGAETATVFARVVPIFTASSYGHPAYAQLARACPAELSTGAEDGAEMGAFRFLQQPQRVANLRVSLGEYLRFGLEAGLIFST